MCSFFVCWAVDYKVEKDDNQYLKNYLEFLLTKVVVVGILNYLSAMTAFLVDLVEQQKVVCSEHWKEMLF